jgi:hypothetical protein
MESPVRFHRLHAWALILIGTWLFAAPFWMSGYASSNSLAAGNSYLVALLIFGLGVASFVHARGLAEWADMALGIGPSNEGGRRH